MRGLREGTTAYAWCIAMTLLIPLLIGLFLLGYVYHNTLPSRVMIPSPQVVSWLWQGLLSVAHARGVLRFCGMGVVQRPCPIMCTC